MGYNALVVVPGIVCPRHARQAAEDDSPPEVGLESITLSQYLCCQPEGSNADAE